MSEALFFIYWIQGSGFLSKHTCKRCCHNFCIRPILNLGQMGLKSSFILYIYQDWNQDAYKWSMIYFIQCYFILHVIFDLAKGYAQLLSIALERRGGHCKPLASKDGVKNVKRFAITVWIEVVICCIQGYKFCLHVIIVEINGKPLISMVRFIHMQLFN